LSSQAGAPTIASMRRGLIVSGMVLLASLAAAVNAQRANQDDRSAVDDQLESWHNIKQGLTGSNGRKYWEAMDHAMVPGPNRVHTLRGTVVSSKPTDHPTELVIAMSDDHTPEVILELIDGRGQGAHAQSPSLAEWPRDFNASRSCLPFK
jgi:hypothetical protein